MESYKNRRFRARLGFALRGFAHAMRSEASLRLQGLAGAAALLVLLVLRPAAVWWALVLLASAAVVSAELFNTAIEHLADVLHPQQSPDVRVVKDCAAAGVLIAVLGALGVGAALLVHLLLPSAP
jgi:undecaprenol kinase